MKLNLLIVAGILLVAVVATVYFTKHYTLSKLSANTGVHKDTLVAAVDGAAS